MIRVLGRALNWFMDKLVLTAAQASALVLIAMVCLIVIEVIGRKIGYPTKVADELSGYMLVAIVCLVVAHIAQQRLHIRITAISDRLPPKAQRWLTLFSDILCLIFLIIVTWKGAELAVSSYTSGAKAWTPLGAPFWIPQALVPLGIGIFALEFLREIIIQIRELAEKGSRRLAE